MDDALRIGRALYRAFVVGQKTPLPPEEQTTLLEVCDEAIIEDVQRGMYQKYYVEYDD